MCWNLEAALGWVCADSALGLGAVVAAGIAAGFASRGWWWQGSNRSGAARPTPRLASAGYRRGAPFGLVRVIGTHLNAKFAYEHKGKCPTAKAGEADDAEAFQTGGSF